MIRLRITAAVLLLSAGLRAQEPDSGGVQTNIMVPMRDGVRLATDGTVAGQDYLTCDDAKHQCVADLPPPTSMYLAACSASWVGSIQPRLSRRTVRTRPPTCGSDSKTSTSQPAS